MAFSPKTQRTTGTPSSRPSSGSGSSGSSASSASTEEMGDVVIKLGSGTFGRVLTSTDSPYVYKAVRRTDNISILKAEYEWTRAVYDALKDQESIGAPKALDYIDGGDADGLTDIPELFREDLLEGCDPNVTSVLVSGRVYPVPRKLRKKIVETFCPKHLKSDDFLSKTFIARVYLGRQDVERNAPQRFFSTYNFALTETKARKLGLPVDDYARTMGFLLARFHFVIGTDGRDAEIVLGMAKDLRNPKLHIMDLNQFRVFSGRPEEVPGLVDAVVTNDPYFPRQGVLLDQMLAAYHAEAEIVAATKENDEVLAVAKIFDTELRAAFNGLKKV